MMQLDVPAPFFPRVLVAGVAAFFTATSAPFVGTAVQNVITVSPWTEVPQVAQRGKAWSHTTLAFVPERCLPQGDLVVTPSIRHASSADLVRAVHDISGLTWEQTAKMFAVSRRAVHAWASGARISAKNLEALAQLAGALESRRDFSPDDNRTWLLDSSTGPSRYDRIRGMNDQAILEALVPVRERLGLG